MTVTLFCGLHDHLRGQAARLYWDAFGGKLGQVLGPEPRALAFFERVIRADMCYTAVDSQGRLIGIAGFKTSTGSFAGGTWDDLEAIYGSLGGRVRGWLLATLGDTVDDGRFMVDGICVAHQHRGKGIGTQLLRALYDEAAARGYHSIRLDVVDANWRARTLYERQGFVATRTETIGILRYLFHFAAATTMERPIASPAD